MQLNKTFSLTSLVRKISLPILVMSACMQLGAVEIPGGDMEKGVGNWIIKEDAILEHDKNNAAPKSKGKASLLLRSNEDGKDRSVVLRFNVTGGTEFILSGWIKAEANGALGLMAIADNSPIGGWQDLSAIKTAGWKPFRKLVKIPDGASKAMVILVIKGKGKIWLDDLKAEAK